MSEAYRIRKLKDEVLKANLLLPEYGLVIFTWGNVSGIDRRSKTLAIKASGVSYEEMKAEHMVLLDLDGKQISKGYKPSSDTRTHLELYKAFPEIGAIVHTHSRMASSWAQACKPIPALGTTHADYFHGEIPCTRKLSKEEIEGDYEKNTGLVIVETFKEKELDPVAVPGVLVAGHGCFAWGKDALEAAHNAAVMEECAYMAYYASSINPQVKPIEDHLLDKHYLRKHGKDAYYGQ